MNDASMMREPFFFVFKYRTANTSHIIDMQAEITHTMKESDEKRVKIRPTKAKMNAKESNMDADVTSHQQETFAIN